MALAQDDVPLLPDLRFVNPSDAVVGASQGRLSVAARMLEGLEFGSSRGRDPPNCLGLACRDYNPRVLLSSS